MSTAAHASTAGRFFTLALTLIALPAFAHPETGAQPVLLTGLVHPLLGADHLLVALGIGLCAVARDRAGLALPAVFLAAMAAGMGFSSLGLHVPSIEPLLAASVAAVGALLAVRQAISTTALAAGAAVLAVLHGHAHFIEAPRDEVSAYLGGLLVGTALLAACAMLAGRRLLQRGLRLGYVGASLALAGIGLFARALA